MNTRQRRVNHPWARTQAGESVVSVLLGAAIGSMVLAGFLAFWISSSKNGTNQAESAKQEAAATETLNRLRRDVQDSSKILVAKSDEMILDRTSKKGGTVRTWYRVVPGDDGGVIERAQKSWSAGTAPSINWPADVDTIATKIDTEATKLTYKNRKAEDLSAPVGAPSDVRLVKIDLTSKTVKGAVKLQTAAAVDSGRGGASGPADRNQPIAVDDKVTVMQGTSVTVNVLANDTYSDLLDVSDISAGLPARVSAVQAGPEGTFQVSAAPDAELTSDPSPGAPYELTDSQGVALAYLRVTVTKAASETPVLNPDTATVSVRDTFWSPSAQTVVDVLDNDECNDGNGKSEPCGSLGANIVVSDPTLVREAGDNFELSVDSNRRVVISVKEAYSNTPREEVVTYRVTDTDTGEYAESTIKVTVGPSILSDSIAGAVVGEAFSLNVYTNDRITTPRGTVAHNAQSTDLRGLSFNPTTGVLSGTPTSTGSINFYYTVTDNTGRSDTGTVLGDVSAAPTAVSMVAGAWEPGAIGSGTSINRIDLSGGNGSYRLYAATSVDVATGNPISPVLICAPCASTDQRHQVAAGSTWYYFLFDSRTTGSTWSSIPAERKATPASVLTFPAEVRVWVGGSDANRDGVPDNIGANQVFWHGSGPIGLRAHTFNRTATTSTSVNLGAVTKSQCVAYAGDGCYRHTGRVRGSETAYSSYGLNDCTLHAGSPRSRTSGYCASAQRGLESVKYADTKVAGPMGDNLSATHDKVAVRAVQLPAAPSGTQRFNSFANDAGVAQRLGNAVPDTCTDRADNATNGLYGCDTNTAKVQWIPETDNTTTDLYSRTGHCDRIDTGSHSTSCYGALRLNGNANPNTWGTGGTLIQTNIKAPHDPAARVTCYGADPSTKDCATLQTFDVPASATDQIDNVVATACNPGGCASGVIGTLTSYPSSPTFTQTYQNPRQYVYFANRSVADDAEGDGSTVNCWSYTGSHPAACRYRSDSQSQFSFSSNDPVRFKATNAVSTPASPSNVFDVAPNAAYSWDTGYFASAPSGGKHTAEVSKVLYPGYVNHLNVVARSNKTGLENTGAKRSLKPPTPNVGMMMGSPVVRGDSLAYGWKYATLWRSVAHYRADAGGTDASGATFAMYPTSWVWHQWSGHQSTAQNAYDACVNGASTSRFCGAVTSDNAPSTGGFALANVTFNDTARNSPASTAGWVHRDGAIPSHPSNQRAGSNAQGWTTGNHNADHWWSTWVMDQPRLTTGPLAGLQAAKVHRNIVGGESNTTTWMPFNSDWRASNFWMSWTQHGANEEGIQGGFSALRLVTHKYTRSTGASYHWDRSTLQNSQQEWCDTHPLEHPNEPMNRCFPNSIPEDTWASAVGGKFTVKEATEGNYDNTSPNNEVAGSKSWYLTALGWSTRTD